MFSGISSYSLFPLLIESLGKPSFKDFWTNSRSHPFTETPIKFLFTAVFYLGALRQMNDVFYRDEDAVSSPSEASSSNSPTSEGGDTQSRRSKSSLSILQKTYMLILFRLSFLTEGGGRFIARLRSYPFLPYLMNSVSCSLGLVYLFVSFSSHFLTGAFPRVDSMKKTQ